MLRSESAAASTATGRFIKGSVIALRLMLWMASLSLSLIVVKYYPLRHGMTGTPKNWQTAASSVLFLKVADHSVTQSLTVTNTQGTDFSGDVFAFARPQALRDVVLKTNLTDLK